MEDILKVNEIDRNTAVFKLSANMIEGERFDELVMLGEILFGDKHPSVLKSYEIITNMVEDENVVKMREKIKLKLEELRAEYDKKDNTPS